VTEKTHSLSAPSELTTTLPPAVVTTVVSEIQPGDPTLWRPQSFSEWEQLERAKTFLAAWSEQVADERALRRGYAKAIFGLISFQVFAVFGLLVAQGLGKVTLDISLLKVLLPSVLSEVFGLGYLVAKYLFSQPLRHSLDSLALGARQASTKSASAAGENPESSLQRGQPAPHT
jgi:hypothetical protein